MVQVPGWMVAGVPFEDMKKTYAVFRKLLKSLPLSHSELAHKIGVDQSTVSRWARGGSRPTLKEMKAAISAIELRIEAVQQRVRHASEVVGAVESAVAAFSRGGPQVFDRVRDATQELHRL